jgi:hypothetical protein
LITIILACKSEFTSHKNGSITSVAAQQSSQQVCYLRKNHFKKCSVHFLFHSPS